MNARILLALVTAGAALAVGGGPATAAEPACAYRPPLYDVCVEADPARPCVHAWGYLAGSRFEVRCLV